MFLGAYEHSLDDKGRVALPVRFREVLSADGDTRLIVTTNVDPAGRCLVAYPVREWQSFLERIGDLPQFDENVIRLKRLHVAGATECAPDRQGRILIPPMLRDYASLKSQVIFAALGTCIELWDRQLWNTERERAKGALPEINTALARLGL
ncbi:MAG: division/cell wall cluster transcriptional repressor MraZ [Deltaproteobacteria bacterium]|nr:division/cell wall cluster transcriptional repressor MraZ [Deltaproteobacteria bacterium]